ncbi:hypothetical protein NPIL_526061 [Nephila pilipes]|uniref:Uncharacterized protein n=1 Tax=Nephila pilipes TaxID=299642 RepID=A0A8X6Q2C4_NEPPI|nr:hypothetical protein NPIL_526061 [Nephila pilipes]
MLFLLNISFACRPTGRPSPERERSQSGVLTRQYRYVIGREGGSPSRRAAVIPRVEEFNLLCLKNLGHVPRFPLPLLSSTHIDWNRNTEGEEEGEREDTILILSDVEKEMESRIFRSAAAAFPLQHSHPHKSSAFT